MTNEQIENKWLDYAKEIGLPDSLNYATKDVIIAALKQAFRSGIETALKTMQEK